MNDVENINEETIFEISTLKIQINRKTLLTFLREKLNRQKKVLKILFFLY